MGAVNGDPIGELVNKLPICHTLGIGCKLSQILQRKTVDLFCLFPTTLSQALFELGVCLRVFHAWRLLTASLP